MNLTAKTSFILLMASSALAAGSKPPIARFPDGFRWCAATAAHQIEGGNSNSDWWDWEQIPGNIKNGDKSGRATDHWNRLEEDTQHLVDLGVTTYRFSVEWAKIETSDGVWDREAIAHYRHEVELLIARGIRPMVTLHHFTFPRWVRAQGAWEWSEIANRFARFTRVVFTQIAPEASEWITVNEPMVHVMGGYYTGQVVPAEKRKLDAIAPVLHGLLAAHAAAYHELHALAAEKGVKIRVGMAHHLRTIDPLHFWNPLDHLVSGAADRIWNWALPEALETGTLTMQMIGTVDIHDTIEGLKGTQDFFGVNYYTGDLVAFSFSQGVTLHHRENAKKTDLGWDIYPKGFRRVLAEVSSRFPGEGIFITENGIADATDSQRPDYLVSHLRAVARAIRDGAPIEGYCHWSWLDNFEWIEGFTPRFGLYEVDYRTFKRTPRASAALFRQAAMTGRVP